MKTPEQTPPPDAIIDLELARRVLRTEAAAILGLIDGIDERFERAVQMLNDCEGRVIVTGMGKSGIVCRKIAATLASTGTPAFFLHPAEAIHGDLGVIQTSDVVIAVSHSGETDELLRVLETIRRLGAHLIAITGDPRSTLAEAADVPLDCHVSEEACPMNLVPTASTTATLALGDALAMTLLVRKGFREEDFAHLHPGGKLGKRLMRVEHLMHEGRSRTSRRRRCLDARRRAGDVGQGPRYDVRGGRRRPPARHHHRRRPPAAPAFDTGPARTDRGRGDEPRPGHGDRVHCSRSRPCT